MMTKDIEKRIYQYILVTGVLSYVITMITISIYKSPNILLFELGIFTNNLLMAILGMFGFWRTDSQEGIYIKLSKDKGDEQ